MHLQKITLTDFRCFERLELDLHPQLTVIVGTNGAGKTAILDGIAAGLSPVLRHLSSANQRLSAAGVGIKDTDFRLVPLGERAGRERWGASNVAQIVVTTTTGLTWDYWRPSARGYDPNHKVGESELIAHLGTVAQSLNSASPLPLPVFAYYGAQRGRIEIPARLRSSTENYSHPTAALVDALNSLSNFKEMLKWFDAAEAAELRDNKGRSLKEFVPSADLEAVRAAILAVLGGDYQNPYFNREHKLVLEPRGGGAPLQVSQLSQGYQSMLALCMDFARRLAIAAAPASETPLKAPAVMLVDEVDLHLHPAWQQRVLGDLIGAFPGTQFIVTTHSPQVLSTVRRENIRVIDVNEAGVLVAEQPLAATYGEPSGDVMHGVMHVDPQPPVAEKPDLLRLTELIDQGQYASDEALRLLAMLRARLGETHPQLKRLERSIERQRVLNA